MRDRGRLSAVHPTVLSHRLRQSKSLRALNAPENLHRAPSETSTSRSAGTKGRSLYEIFKIIKRLLPFAPVAQNVVIRACAAQNVRLMFLHAQPLET
jgi:hypothetical protein